MGAWIETSNRAKGAGEATVAPFMGAWIETLAEAGIFVLFYGRSLHGSVD